MQINQMHSNIINEQQRHVLNMLSVLFSVAGVIFFFLNIYRGLVALACVELLMSATSLWIFFKMKRTEDYQAFQKIAFVYLLLFYSLMGFAFCQTSVSVSVFVWLVLIPVLSYVLLGRKLGFYMTVFFMTMNLTIFVLFSSHDLFVKQPISLANITICITILWYTSHVYERGNENIKKQLANMATHDTLTGLFNRHALQHIFQQHQQNNRLSMAVLDIDWFKKINDQYGHDVGDKALKVVAKKIQQVVKQRSHVPEEACVFRIGGEEFCILLPDTPLKQTHMLLQTLLKDIEKLVININKTQNITLTLSAGVAEYPEEVNTLAELQRLADQRLYKAKHAGRNQVVMLG